MYEDDYNETTLLNINNDYNETTLLNENDNNWETTLLKHTDSNSILSGGEQGYLPREAAKAVISNIISQEKGSIMKIPYKVGSEYGKVDFYVSNSTVSRCHIVIDYIDGNYYVTDNNSTNGTSLDGIRLEKNRPVKLYNGALLQLADELLQFNIKE